MRTTHWPYRLISLVFGAADALAGQTLPRIALKPAMATLDAEFMGITSVREVADGRVIATDGRDQKLYLADFRANAATMLGRKGSGPGEWRGVGLVQELAADSSIMSDHGLRRWLLFSGAQIVGTVPPDHPAVRASPNILGIDRFGHVLFESQIPMRAGNNVYTRADSVTLTFVDRSSGRSDTIGKIRMTPFRREVTMDSMGRVRSFWPHATEPHAQGEAAYLFFDGWLAVVRLEPTRVDWRSPAGQWMLGKPFPLRPEPVDAAERKAIAERRAESRADARRHGVPSPNDNAFPTALPLVTTLARLAPDGRLLLDRSKHASHPGTRYLVVNRHGNIDGEITMGDKARIVGFGPRAMYLAVTDENDIERLRKHPWP